MQKDKLVATEKYQDVECGTGSAADDTVITMHGASWVPETAGDTPYREDHLTTMLGT